MKVVAVVGANGKMGRLVCEGLEGEYDIKKIDIGDSLEDAGKLDLVIDFANAETSVSSAKFCAKNNIKLIIGSTGQTEKQLAEIEKASKVVPILKAGNFSLGIAWLKKTLASVAKLKAEDIIIFEKHHKNKKDSPSGTALELEKVIESFCGIKPQILAERGGKEIGTHSIDIYFGEEVITLKHQTFSREVFADGACLAVKFLLNQTIPKLYSFDNILDKDF